MTIGACFVIGIPRAIKKGDRIIDRPFGDSILRDDQVVTGFPDANSFFASPTR